MIKFEKVSYGQFYDSYKEMNPELDAEFIGQMYDDLKLPMRGTAKSAGYDIFAPYSFELYPGEKIKIPTGIRALMPGNVVLKIYPRSGLGTKNRFTPANLVGIVDADYAESANEGHIFMMMVNDGDKPVTIENGKAFCQGIFQNYLTTDDDVVTTTRNGGFGSTDEVFVRGMSLVEEEPKDTPVWEFTMTTSNEAVVLS